MSPILVTGAAGFIGYHLARVLLEQGRPVVGVDDLNDHYDVALKRARLARLQATPGFTFHRLDLAERPSCEALFERVAPREVVHLAAHAGVRASVEHPHGYIDSNIVAFNHVLEGCRTVGAAHLVFASSSSVYGNTPTQPLAEEAGVDHPISLYAATKRANELMAHACAHIHGLPCTGLRYFTVYGPWGRPDMALFLFTRAIARGEPIRLFNRGEMVRGFTHVDDAVEGTLRALAEPPRPDPGWDAEARDPATSSAPFRVLNLGSPDPVPLTRLVALIEQAVGRPAKVEELPMQPGDVKATAADNQRLERLTGFAPRVDIERGVAGFVAWYLETYGDD